MDPCAFDLDALAAFEFLAQQAQPTADGDFPRTLLAAGFAIDGVCVPPIGPR